MTDHDVAVLVPVLHRVHRIRPFVESLRRSTPEPHRVVFIGTTRDDGVLAEVKAVAAEFGGISLEVLPRHELGDYARKINHGFRVTSEPFVFTAADDLEFTPGWCSAALARFDDPSVGVVGTQDRCNRRTIAGTHSTHLMFRRRYVDEHGTIDEPGKVFHEGYPHEFVDDEAVGTAKLRGAWMFAGDSVVEHLHPMNGRAPMDPLYAAQGERMRRGRRTFIDRRQLWTPAPAPPTRSSVSVIVASFGDDRWSKMAEERAVPSVEAEKPGELIWHHDAGGTLADVRNVAAGTASREWLLFVDADDELEPGYLDAMAKAPPGDLLAPAVRYVNEYDDPATKSAVTFGDRDMRILNRCPIGTLIRRELFLEVGGFWNERAWEDWSLFRRAWLTGAKIVDVPDAVYRAHVDQAGRNGTVTNPDGLRRQITTTHAQWLRRYRNGGAR